MPNWVQTNYVFKGDTAEITALDNAMKQHQSPCDEVDLSDIIDHFGGNSGNIPCRGYVAEYNLLNPCALEVKTLTAHFPLHGTWDFVCTKLSSLDYQFIEIN